MSQRMPRSLRQPLSHSRTPAARHLLEASHGWFRVRSWSAATCAIAAALLAPAAAAQARDQIAPSAPSELRVTAREAGVTLTWSRSSDARGVHRYRLYRRLAGRPWPRRPFHSVPARRHPRATVRLANAGRYSFRVRAVDRAGNLSRASAPARVPDPDPPAASTCRTTGTDGAARWPGACWRPFAASSPFNRRIPDAPPLASNSDAVVRRLLSWGPPQSLLAGHADTEHDYFHPLYHARPTDPLYTVRCLRWTSSCTVHGEQVRIPAAARAAGGGDGHMAVIDEASGWEYDFWQVRSKDADGGTISVSHGGRTRLDGDGRGVNATAAWFALSAGIIRAVEMQAGRIDHALFAHIKCTAGGSVYPAQPGTTAAPCSTFGLANDDAPPLGARIQLNMTAAEIDALNVPAWKKTILRALAEYGMIVGDTDGGNAAWGIQGESGSGYTSFGAVDPWATFAQSIGASLWDGIRVLDMKSAVDWTRLRVVAPCVSDGSC